MESKPQREVKKVSRPYFKELLVQRFQSELDFEDEDAYKVAMLLSGELDITIRRLQARVMDAAGIPKLETEDESEESKAKRQEFKDLFNGFFKDVVGRQEMGLGMLGILIRKYYKKIDD